jgi:hypothetical protein
MFARNLLMSVFVRAKQNVSELLEEKNSQG